MEKHSGKSSTDLNRRQLLAVAGAGSLMLGQGLAQAQVPGQQPGQPRGRPVVFTHTTVVNPDLTQEDVALAVVGDRIAAIGPTDEVLRNYPNADVYDGRGKALLPGFINCHMHMSAVIARGYNEDFGFPNSIRLAVSPEGLLSADERQLMIQVAALESIKTGTTTVVENVGEILPHAATLAASGLRCVFAEAVRDAENVPGPMYPEGLANTKEAPRFSAKLRDEGMQRIHDLFSAWHGKHEGRIRVFPAAGLAETSSPELLRALRTFADQHDLGYTIHLSQTTWERDFMQKWHGLTPPQFLDRHGFLGPRLFAAHCRYVDEGDRRLLGERQVIVSHQASMAANRGALPPIAKLRAAGCKIALGTDNNTNDLFSVMKVALLTERISRTEDARPGTRPQPEDMLADAAQGGAAAVNQEADLGLLEVGRKADIIVIDTMKAYLQPHGRILSAIVHGGNSSDIESMMVDGQFLMRQNKVLTMDEDRIIADAARVSKRVWDEVRRSNPPIPIPREPRPA